MPQVAKADNLTANLGSQDSRRIRQHIFSDLSPIAVDLALRYIRITERFNYEQANRELLDIHGYLRVRDLNLCDSVEELRKSAKRCAEKCLFTRQDAPTSQEAYQTILTIVESYDLTPPKPQNNDLEPTLNRMCCEQWWFRKIKTLRLRKIEAISRNIALVSRCRSTYASEYIVHQKRQQKENNRTYLESTFISNESGERYSLQDLADRSVSNPAIRRAELMTRIKGFEMVADLSGHVGEFYTLTTPSRMHACLHAGKINPHFDKTTPLQAHEHLTHLWALIRAELHRQGIRPYGFRVVEPHHDGTPHWHLLLFMPETHRAIVRDIMQRYALADSGDEPGAKLHRFKAISIDPEKGTAAGYIAKYIAKNIDGYALDEDLYGNKAAEASERITAWANTWGIRQFQQIGGPSVTVWRQLRKLGKTAETDLEAIRESATASDWAAFMLAMGGIEIPRKDHLIKPYYDHSRQLNPDTGEVTHILKGRYGNDKPKQIAGIYWDSKVYDSRKHFWTLSTEFSEAKPNGCAAAAAHRSESPPKN